MLSRSVIFFVFSSGYQRKSNRSPLFLGESFIPSVIEDQHPFPGWAFVRVCFVLFKSGVICAGTAILLTLLEFLFLISLAISVQMICEISNEYFHPAEDPRAEAAQS